MSVHHRPMRLLYTPWYRRYMEELILAGWFVAALLAGSLAWLSLDKVESWFR